MRWSFILHESSHTNLAWSESHKQVIVKPRDHFAVTLAGYGDGSTIFFKALGPRGQ